MGDITGRPKAPAQQVVYVPQYVYPNSSSGTSTNTTPSNANTETDTGTTVPTPAEQREKSLLSRSRSRIGTILTGFRGILSPAESDNQRKTLLGE